MWAGWVALGPGDPFVGDDYVELVNNQRAYSYARNSGISWLLECLDCPEAGLVMPGGPNFLDPVSDKAPWYDPLNPDTWGFLGVVGLEVVGADASTRQVTITNTLQAGGVAGPPYYGPRTLVFRGLLIAEDECSLQAGLDWLRYACISHEDPCHGDALTFFDCCPCVCDDDESIGPCWPGDYEELSIGPICARLSTAPPAYWNGTTGSIGPYTTNVAALSDYERATFVLHVRGPNGIGPVASQWSAGSNQRSWQVQMDDDPAQLLLATSATGTATTLTQTANGADVLPSTDQHLALSREVLGGQERLHSWTSTGGAWAKMSVTPWVPVIQPLDMSESLPMRIGNTMLTGAPSPDTNFFGRIYSVELREGLDPAPGATNPTITFPGTANNYLSVDNADALNIPTDLEVVFAIDSEDFMTFGKWRNPDGRSWQIFVIDTTITLFYSLNGTTSLSAATPPFEDVSAFHWYKVTRNSSNGTVQFHRAPLLAAWAPEPTGAEWELFATVAGTTGPLPYISGGPPVEIGGSATVANDGRLHRLIVRNYVTTSNSTKALHLPNTSGVHVAAPVTPSLDLVGDLDVAIRATMVIAEAATHTFLCKSGGTNNRSWEISYVNQRWNFRCCVAAAPGVVITFQPNVAQTLQQSMWFRVTRNATTGAVNMYTAADATAVPTTWTLIPGGSLTGTAGALVNSTAPVEIGGRNGGVSEFGSGRLRRAIIRNGINGPIVFDLSDQDPPHAAVDTFTSTSGHTMTVHRNNAATPIYGTVLDVDDGLIPDDTTPSFPAATGQTVTVHGAPIDTVPVSVMWRFDASEHPTGGSFPLGNVDPRGRLWFLPSGALLPPGLPEQGAVWWPRTYAELTSGPPADDPDWCAWVKTYRDLTVGPPGWSCCVDECVVPYLRQFHNARITQGPIILRQPVMNSCGALAEIEVTVVAADPRKYTLPSAVLRTIVDPGEPHVEMQALSAAPPDPFAIGGVTRLATRTVERPEMRSEWVRTIESSTPPTRGNIMRTAVPTITLASANGDIGEVRLGLWRDGGLVTGFWLPFIPSGSTVTIDGGLRRVIASLNGSERILTGYARDYDGGRVTWPDLGHGVFELTVDQEPERAGRLVVEVHAVDVGLS